MNLELGGSAKNQRIDGMPLYSCNWELHRREGEDLRATVMSVQYGNVRTAVAALDGLRK